MLGIYFAIVCAKIDVVFDLDFFFLLEIMIYFESKLGPTLFLNK